MGPCVRVGAVIVSVSAVMWAPPAHATPLAPGQVIRIGPIAGTGTPTSDYGIGATDLCEFMEFTTELLQVCGDSFAGQGVGFGGWYSPVALHVDRASLDNPDGVRYTGVSGVFSPLLADPTPRGSSQLPAGVVSINRENWLLVTTTASLRPQSSRLVKAEAAEDHWATVPGSVRDAGYAAGGQSQISGFYDPIPRPDSETGWVYIVANNFDRTAPVTLYRVPPADFSDRSRWQGWSPAGWGTTPTPLWGDRIGEMSVRQIDGMTVFSYFNASTGNMEVRVAADATGLGSAPVTTVVRAYAWPEPADSLPPPEVNQLAQPYGGYIAPGSTLDNVRVFVSQWNTQSRERAPYRVIQFAVNPLR
ncbi:DUF4185 domain-containing protein [Mycolicibacterium tokaiense]|uniref:Putative secreted protein n=1 Tax=Mycolicibacterium tokaiense TaxID=39695 RepID=A0A378TGK5_9MYCO|nr:hypothetical protein MTOK_19740 [Mycolicibacterium tokaiense]STZ59297.1 putative secreted protein [Mycolicibacterium tokaiense]